jgi:WD40 repeat protein
MVGDPNQRLAALALAARAAAPFARRGQTPPPEALQGLHDAIASAPVALPLAGLGTGAYDLAATADGARLAVVAEDRTVGVWDGRTGAMVTSFRSAQAVPAHVTWSPDERHLVVCGYNDDAEVWTPATGALVRLDTGAQTACGFAPDGRVVTAADALVWWDAATGAERARVPLARPAGRLAVSASGVVAVADVDGTLVVHDPRTGVTRVVDGSAGVPTAVAVSPGGTRVAVAHVDGRLHVVEPGAGGGGPGARLVAEDPAHPPGTLLFLDERRLVAWMPPAALSAPVPDVLLYDLDGGGVTVLSEGPTAGVRRVGPERIAGLRAGQLEVWDVTGGGALVALPIGSAMIMDVEAVGPDGRLAAAQRNRPPTLWDARAGGDTGLLVGHTREITRLDVSGGRALTVSLDGTAQVWDVAGARRTAVVRGEVELLDGAWAPDGARFVTAGMDGVARVYGAGGELVAALGVPGPPATVVRFGADGARVAVADVEGAVRVLAVAGGAAAAPALVLDAGAAAGTASAIAFSGDGRWIATGHGDGGVRLWDAASGALAGVVASDVPDDHDGVFTVSFLGDARLLVAHTGRTRIVRVPDLMPLATLEGRPADTARSPLAPDGRTLALVQPLGVVTLHDLDGGAVRRLEGHGALVLAAAWSPDGSLLVTAGMDHAAKVWDVAGGRVQALFTITHPYMVTVQAAWSSDARWVLLAGRGGELRVDPVRVDDALARACALLRAFGRDGDAGGACRQ